MKWSYQIASAFGIPIKLHLTFLLLLAFLTVRLNPQPQGGFSIHLGNAILVVLLFGCVLLHELSHSLTAMKNGVRVRSITLLPIGGVAQMATMPEEPAQEVKIALAGPLASYCLAAAVFVVSGFLGQAGSVLAFPASAFESGMLSRLFWANIMLGTLNLLPAFPMDGGRVLRGILAKRIGMVAATRWAVGFGQAFAIALYFLGALYWHQLGFLILLAVFVYIGARNEEEEVEFRSEIADATAAEAMLVKFDSLAPRMTVGESLEVLRHSSQEEFPVLDGDKLVGMISKNDVISALGEADSQVIIGEIMHTDFIQSTADTRLGAIFRQMEQHEKDVVPILAEGKVVGLLSYDQVGRYHSLKR